jgi:hypothetical protein
MILLDLYQIVPFGIHTLIVRNLEESKNELHHMNVQSD